MQCIFFVINLHCFIKQTYEQMCLIAYNYLERSELIVKKINFNLNIQWIKRVQKVLGDICI